VGIRRPAALRSRLGPRFASAPETDHCRRPGFKWSKGGPCGCREMPNTRPVGRRPAGRQRNDGYSAGPGGCRPGSSSTCGAVPVAPAPGNPPQSPPLLKASVQAGSFLMKEKCRRPPVGALQSGASPQLSCARARKAGIATGCSPCGPGSGSCQGAPERPFG